MPREEKWKLEKHTFSCQYFGRLQDFSVSVPCWKLWGERNCTHLLAAFSVPPQRTEGALGGAVEDPGSIWVWSDEWDQLRDEDKTWILFGKVVIYSGQVPLTLGLTQGMEQFLCFAQKNPERFPNLDWMCLFKELFPMQVMLNVWDDMSE